MKVFFLFMKKVINLFHAYTCDDFIECDISQSLEIEGNKSRAQSGKRSVVFSISSTEPLIK